MKTKSKNIQVSSLVSDAETEVLKKLWEEAPLTSNEIIERMDGEGSSHPRTVKTLINRLLKKGALRHEEHNRKYLYYPTLSSDEFYHSRARSFLDKFFGGELSPLISMFSQTGELSEAEIKDLKMLINEIDKTGRSKS